MSLIVLDKGDQKCIFLEYDKHYTTLTNHELFVVSANSSKMFCENVLENGYLIVVSPLIVSDKVDHLGLLHK